MKICLSPPCDQSAITHYTVAWDAEFRNMISVDLFVLESPHGATINLLLEFNTRLHTRNQIILI